MKTNKPKPRTSVFAYKHFIGIKSDHNAEGLLNKPAKPGQLGFVVQASAIDISNEAIALLDKIPRSADSIGDIDIFNSVDGVIFAWLGGPLSIKDAESEISGSRTYDPSLLKGVAIIVPNDPPADFITACDKIQKQKKKQ